MRKSLSTESVYQQRRVATSLTPAAATSGIKSVMKFSMALKALTGMRVSGGEDWTVAGTETVDESGKCVNCRCEEGISFNAREEGEDRSETHFGSSVPKLHQAVLRTREAVETSDAVQRMRVACFAS